MAKNWSTDPMNKWNPSKGGKTVLHDMSLQEIEDEVVKNSTFKDIKTICRSAATTVEDLTRNFLGEMISFEKLTYLQAERLLNDYIDETFCFNEHKQPSK